MNSPPEIQVPASRFNEKELIADVEYVRVTASDADGDALYFEWSGVPFDVEIPPEEPIPLPHDDETWWTSTYKVPRDARLDGRTIQVLVTDGEPGDEAIVEWLVTVEQ